MIRNEVEIVEKESN